MEQELKDKLYEHALKLLAMRSHSEKELRRKLTLYLIRRKLTTGLTLLDGIVKRLQEQKYLSDEEFAEQFSISRQSGKPRSKRMLSFELQKRGLAREVIEKTLDEYDEVEACRKLAAKKQRYSKEELTAFLQRQGFPWEIINDTVHRIRQ